MPEYENCSQRVVTLAQSDVPVSVSTETLVVQGGIGVATILSLSLLCNSVARLVKAIRAD